MIQRYRQTATKISWDTVKELVFKINQLRVADYKEMTVEPTTPDITDTKSWSIVHYWIEE